ncbi:MAG TPA: glycoside hydrolase family 5 protein [Verrucomicrobiae bacterium]
MPIAYGQANPCKLASTARFDLTSASVSLEKAQVLTGGGQMERANWISGEAKTRSYTANFAVSRLDWTECAIRFLPLASGVVELKLMGPWEEASAGMLYREEILWDDLSAEGAELQNGGFEEAGADGKSIAGWKGSPAETAAGGVNAKEGSHYARSWHNQPLTAQLKVRENTAVTLHLFARAAVPPDFKDMRRITSLDTPAHKAAKQFMKGANFGNYLEAPPGQNWGAKYSKADCIAMEKEGFDHIRLPVAWHHYAGAPPEFKLSAEIYSKVDAIVNNALKYDLNVIVNIHHFDAFTSNPAAQKGKFIALWRQIAAHYADSPPGVAFELLNEPKDKATTSVLNPIYAEVIREIRKSNPRRVIFLGPSKWNSIDELPSLMLPDDEQNLIVTVHCYDPFYFTHQGANWTGSDTKTKGIIFPGPPEKPIEADPSLKKGVLDWIQRYNTLPREKNPSSPNAFRGKIKKAHEWSEYYGRPVHMGEFGAYIGADPVSRATFYREFRHELDVNHIGWCVWDWKAGFKYWDDATGKPAPEMHEALFGK